MSATCVVNARVLTADRSRPRAKAVAYRDGRIIPPVIVYHVPGHHALVNTMAMRDRGIPESVADPAGGAFVRDAADRLTGLCLDTATSLILSVELEIGCHGPNFHTLLPGQDSVALLDAASHAFLKVGLTTVCDPQVTRREMTACREAHRLGVLRLRTVMMPLSVHLDDFAAIGMAGPFGDDMLRVGPMKLYSDGTLIGGTAWFSTPYGERAHRLEPMRDELDAGIRPVLSSDAFVTSFNPLLTIANALRRTTLNGLLIGADQALTLDQAVYAHTVDAPVAIRMEDRLGSLEVGELADLVVLDGALEGATPAEIAALPVWRTVLGGETLWQA